MAAVYAAHLAELKESGARLVERVLLTPPGVMTGHLSPSYVKPAGSLAAALVLAAVTAVCGAAPKPLPPGEALTETERLEAIGRAAVWAPIDIPSVDFKKGPEAADGFEPDALVTCDYKETKMDGQSAKFTCETKPGESIKVKYGPRNPEVFGEVLSSRLLWGLGFYADRMYPVRVECRGCSHDPDALPAPTQTTNTFDPAAVERKLPGRSMEIVEGSGWKWSELDEIGPSAPLDTRAQRDGLKLLAAFIQHSDSKRDNQRLLCPKGQEEGPRGCRAPILMIQDLGLTFGAASFLNKAKHAVSFEHWQEEPVWKDRGKCVAQLKASITDNFSHPTIHEAGRAFLAGLLSQLSDAQLRDLFEVARVDRRSAHVKDNPEDDLPVATVDQWVAAFKAKRAEIVNHRCPA
jgi:hypothetical protein